MKTVLDGNTHPPSPRAKPNLVHDYSSPCSECWELEKPRVIFFFFSNFLLAVSNKSLSYCFLAVFEFMHSCYIIYYLFL